MTDPHLRNSVDDFVIQALEGFELAHSSTVELHRDPAFVARRTLTPGKVAVVSGGGSGHEPLHVGYVGLGMLDAAVPGAVFASPSVKQIEAAAMHVESGGGVAFVVKNYTGDVLNFRLASQRLVARGIPNETIIVADDVATTSAPIGARGTAATVLVEKLVGAAAERGHALESIAAMGRTVAAASRSVAFSWRGSTRPGSSTPSFEVPAGHLMFGVGIHGEPGTETKGWKPGSALASDLVDALGDLEGPTPQVIVLANNLGGATSLETHLLLREAAYALRRRGVNPVRCLSGAYATALDMPGFSLTVVPVDGEQLGLWDDPVRTPALTW